MRSAALIALLALPALAPPPPLTLDAIAVKAEELPEAVALVEGIHTNAPHPRSFPVDEEYKAMARTDSAFAEARQRKELQELLQ